MAKASKKPSAKKKTKSSKSRLFVCAEAGNEPELQAGDASRLGDSKPTVDQVSTTPHKSSRNGTDIDHIVIHYTTSRSLSGTLSWFKDPVSEVSAHYVIAQNGKLVQVVSDSENAWHAGNKPMNRRSIGIEHSARNGDAITTKQGEKSAALIAWLMKEYGVPKANVIPHVCVKRTDCCGDLFMNFGGAAGASCEKQKNALHKWMTSVGL